MANLTSEVKRQPFGLSQAKANLALASVSVAGAIAKGEGIGLPHCQHSWCGYRQLERVGLPRPPLTTARQTFSLTFVWNLFFI
jgi:hypothetical protein